MSNLKDTLERAGATAVQALATVLTAGAAPIALPGLPAWAAALLGVAVAVVLAVVKSLGVQAQMSAAWSELRASLAQAIAAKGATVTVVHPDVPEPPAAPPASHPPTP